MTTTALVVLESCSRYRLVTGLAESYGDDWRSEAAIPSIGDVYRAKAWGKKTFTSVPGMLCTGTLPRCVGDGVDWNWVNPFFLEDLYQYTNPYIALPNPWGGSCIWPLVEQHDAEMSEKNRNWCTKRTGGVARNMPNADETSARPPSDEILDDFASWEAGKDDWFLYLHVQETHIRENYVDDPIAYADDVVSRVLEYDPNNIVVTSDHSELYSDDVFLAANADDLWDLEDGNKVIGMK